LSYQLIKKKGAKLINGKPSENYTTTPTPRGQAHKNREQPNSAMKHHFLEDLAIHHRRREDNTTTMGGANTGHSNVDKDASPLRSYIKVMLTTNIEGNLIVRTT
jgi:hypothetical protein